MDKSVKEEFFVYLANNLFLDQNITFDVYSKDYVYTIKGKSYLGRGAGNNILYLDSDGVLNAGKEGISSNFYRILGEINPRVGRRFDTIKGLLNKIMQISRAQGNYIANAPFKTFTGPDIDKLIPTNLLVDFEKTVKDLEKELKECKLTEEESKIAAVHAANITPYTPNIFQALAEIENDLGYKIFVASAGPDIAVKEQAKRLSIDENFVKASNFRFTRGKLSSIEAYAGIRKKVEDGNHEACVFVTDDWSSDFRIASTFGLGLVTLVTQEQKNFPCRIYAKLPEIREDFSKLPEFVRRYQWARVYAELLSPSGIKRVRALIKQINSLSNQFADEKHAKDLIKEFLNLTSFVIPDQCYEIRKLLEDLESTDVERHKKIIPEIISRINETPLAKAGEKFDIGLENYVDWEKHV